VRDAEPADVFVSADKVLERLEATKTEAAEAGTTAPKVLFNEAAMRASTVLEEVSAANEALKSAKL